MSLFAKALMKNIGTLHINMSKSAFPNGCVLACSKCSQRREASTEDCSTFLKFGWPKCCNLTMKLET